MPILQDTQDIILPHPSTNEPIDSEEDEEGIQDEDFTPKWNPI